MVRLFFLIVAFVILATLLVRSRRAKAAEAAPPVVAQPIATVVSAPPRADGARDPYARLGTCPSCGRPMVERVGKRGAQKGKPYLVCSGDPPCATVAADA